MKKLSLAIAFALISFSFVSAQTSNFQVTYDIDLSGADLPPMAKMMMKNASMEMSFRDQAARVDMDMGMGGQSTMIADDAAKKGVILMSMMGMKRAMEMGEEEFAEGQKQSSQLSFKKTNETKEIAGRTCHHAIGTDTEGNSFDFWYCKDFKPKHMVSGYSFDGIEGFPLEMEMMQDGMRMKMKAKSVNTDQLSASLFKPEIPKGYKVMTREEMEKMGGQ